MNATQSHYGTTLFGGLLGVIAEALGGRLNAASYRPALAMAAATGTAGDPACGGPVAPARPEGPGLLGRLGERLWRRQLHSVGVHVARSDDIFANLDRWLWKQHMRETEAWLAQSTDVFDLEARIRHLERSRDGHVF
jgi:hypothetical protein